MINRAKISVLVAARKNSKYLAKFLAGFMVQTSCDYRTELLVMTNREDTWNYELIYMYRHLNRLARSTAPELSIEFFTEDLQLGRAGLHQYFNLLLQHATGDWIIYFCEDHFIVMNGWDKYIIDFAEERSLNPSKPWCLIPKFDNCGAMNQVLSRGYVRALGGKLGRHGWIDSYINHVNTQAFADTGSQVLRMDPEMFHDFTHDDPSPMSDAHMQSIIGPAAHRLPEFDSDEVRALIAHDAQKLREALQ